MRFGICAISAILPKFLRRRLRPVKESVIPVDPLRPTGRYLPRGGKLQNQWQKPPALRPRESTGGGGGTKYARHRGVSIRDDSLLLQLHLGTGVFELLLDLGGFVLVDVRLHFLGRAFDQVLGFLEAQARDRTHFLDHVDLLLAGVGQDDGELGLFGGWRGSGGRGSSS